MTTNTLYLDLELDASVKLQVKETPSLNLEVESFSKSTDSIVITEVLEVHTSSVEIEILEDSSSLVIPGSNSVTYTVGATPVYGNRAVKLVNNHITHANNNDIGFNIIGISTQAGSWGSNVTVITYGQYTDNSFNWIPEEPIFLTTEGTLSQTPPTEGICLVIGVATSTKSIFIRVEQPVYFINED